VRRSPRFHAHEFGPVQYRYIGPDVFPLPTDPIPGHSEQVKRVRIEEGRKVRTVQRGGPTSSRRNGAPIPVMRVTVLPWEGMKVRMHFPHSNRGRADAEDSYLPNFLPQTNRFNVRIGTSYLRTASANFEWVMLLDGFRLGRGR